MHVSSHIKGKVCQVFHGQTLHHATMHLQVQTMRELTNETQLLRLIRDVGIHRPDGPNCHPKWANAKMYYGDEWPHAISTSVKERVRAGMADACAAPSLPVTMNDEACAIRQTCWYPIGLWQLPRQLSCALLSLSRLHIRTAATIGTFTGWTDVFMYSYLRRVHEMRGFGDKTMSMLSSIQRPFRAATVDVIDQRTPCVEHLMNREHIRFIHQSIPTEGPRRILQGLASEFQHDMDTEGETMPSVALIDLCFIDANHSYAGVMQDIIQAWPFCRVLALHDTRQATGVKLAWANLKHRAALSKVKARTAHMRRADEAFECHAPLRDENGRFMASPKRMGIGIYVKAE